MMTRVRLREIAWYKKQPWYWLLDEAAAVRREVVQLDQRYRVWLPQIRTTYPQLQSAMYSELKDRRLAHDDTSLPTGGPWHARQPLRGVLWAEQPSIYWLSDESADVRCRVVRLDQRYGAWLSQIRNLESICHSAAAQETCPR